jgi:TPP-dependent pyruvate/acetoin dehydrogenase alpha subunit
VNDTERVRALNAYRRLYLVRRCEETIQEHYPEDEMKTPVHLSIGQEVPAVGVCEALGPADRLFGTYRSHALYLARSEDTDGFFGELYGRVTGAARGKAGSMHLASPAHGLMLTSAVVGTTIPLALGAALALERQGSRGRGVVFFGDGATGEGCFWESLNFACARALRVVFVCEDNGLAIHSRRESREGYAGLPSVLERFRCTTLVSESTDVLEIRDLAMRGLAEQERSGGPLFLYLRCYRFVEHVGPAIDRSFELGYRRRDEFETWKTLDPIGVAQGRLRELGIPLDALRRVESEVDAKILKSVARARGAQAPGVRELREGVYA